MTEFKTSKEIRDTFAREMLSGAKVPHRTSQPLIRMHGGKPVLAAFAFLFSADDIRAGEVGRPTFWAIADLETGRLLEEFGSRDKDFSAEPYESRYSINYNAGERFGAEYLDQAYALLDEVRGEYIASGTIDSEAYSRYFAMLVEAVPPDYRVFYRELGSPEALT